MATVLESTIESEIAAYTKMQPELEAKHLNRWVVVHHGKVQGVYDDFAGAARDAVKRFGRGPYLIRQVGQKPVPMPASVAYSRVTYGR